MNVVDYNNAIDIAKAINKYIKIKDWVASTAYIVGQYVNNDGVLYKCTTANNDATFDPTNWQKVAGGGLDEWEPSTLYSVDDIVIYNNKIYQCNTAHTSGATFLPDESKWTEISACITRIPNWAANEDYVVGDLVAYDAKIYRCITAHTSGSTFDSTEEAKWEELSPTINEISLWAAATDYEVGQLVIYDNKLYRCTTAHTSTSSFNSDINNWQEIGSNSLDAWKASTTYKVDDFIYKDGQIYRCITAHTSDSSNFYVDITKWELLDTKWRAENWVASKYYAIGDVVLYDNRLFKCITANTSSSDFATDYDKWSAISSRLELWKTNTYYAVGDMVIYNNKLYRCKTRHTSTTTLSADIANWDLISSGGIDNWKANEDYSVNNVVIYNNKIYQCKTAHSAGSTFDYSKWKEISSSDIDLWATNFDYIVGDIVIYDNQLYRCITAHTSTSNFSDTITRWQILDTKWHAKNWVTNTYYLENEVVLYNNTPYRCTTAHTSLGTFELDKADWESLSANIREWVSGTTYKVGDTVIYNNRLYECVNSDNEEVFTRSNWKELSKCNIEVWRGAPDTNTLALLHFDSSDEPYKNEYGASFSKGTVGSGIYNHVNTWVLGGSGYSIATESIGGIKSPDYEFTTGSEVYTVEWWHYSSSHHIWTEGADTVNVKDSAGNITSLRYIDSHNGKPFSIYGTQVYEFLEGIPYHIALVISGTTVKTYINGTSVSTITRPTANSKFWIHGDHGVSQSSDNILMDELRISNIDRYPSDFTPQTEPFLDPNFDGYKVNDLVVYNDKIYRCIIANNDVTFTSSKWVEVSKSEIPYWTSGNDYYANSVVVYNNSLYIATSDVIGSIVDPSQDTANWVSLSSKDIDFWKANKQYEVEDVVMYNSADEYNPSNNYVGGEIVKKGNTTYVVSTDPSIEYDLTSVTTSSPTVTIEPGITATVSTSVSVSLDLDSIMDSSLSTNATTDRNYINIAFSSPVNVDLVDIYGGQQLNTGYNVIYTDADGNDVDLGFKHLYPEGTTSGDATFYSGFDWYITPIGKEVSNIKLQFTPTSSSYYVTRIHQIKLTKSANTLSVADDSMINFYYCAIANSDSTFDDSKWQLIGGGGGSSGATIEEWASGNDYTSGDIIIYNNNLYKVVNDVTGATDTPDNSNDYVKLGGDSIKTWVGNTNYKAGTIVLRQNRLYRNSNDIPYTVADFSRDDWTPLSVVLEDWASNREYKIGDFVVFNDVLYECITDNNDITFNSAKWKPISKEGINAWQSNKQYALYDLVVEDEELYMCISPHTSSSDFQTDLDAERWKLIGGGGGSGGDWNQVTKMNVVAPLDVDINIPYTNTFKRPPVEVLKYEQGTTDITTNVLNFGVGDGSKFEVDGVTAKDSPFITFDGVAKPNHDILYSFGTPTQMVNKYYSESEEIDLDDFKVVGEVSLE